MAYKEKEIVKKYYSISEVAQHFKVATSLIRFWESEFEIIRPKKNSKGNRQFTQEDIDNIKVVYQLVKEKGYTLQGAKEILKKEASENPVQQTVTGYTELLSKNNSSITLSEMFCIGTR